MAEYRAYENYIGDAVYVFRSKFNDVVLYTSNGIQETNRVVLEPAVLEAFMRWMNRVEKEEEASG